MKIILVKIHNVIQYHRDPFWVIVGRLLKPHTMESLSGLRKVNLISRDWEEGVNILAVVGSFTALWHGLCSIFRVAITWEFWPNTFASLAEAKSLSRLFQWDRTSSCPWCTQLKSLNSEVELLRESIWHLLCSSLGLGDHCVSFWL